MTSNQHNIPVGYYSRKEVVALLGFRPGIRLAPDAHINNDTPIFIKEKVDALKAEADERGRRALESVRTEKEGG